MKFSFLFMPPYASSTIIGIGVISGAVSGYLLDQMSFKLMCAAIVAGLTQVIIRQIEAGNTVVTGDKPTIMADTATITAPSTTKTSSVGPLTLMLVATLSLNACQDPRYAQALAAAQQACTAHAVIVAVEPALAAAHPAAEAQVQQGCAIVAVLPPATSK